jgi:FSR family fosmidomycin resistance protein-like MFS transporter
VAGKAAGGVLADRFGRAAVGVGAVVLSAPLLVVAPGVAAVGIAGMFLFNMTMPVTLVAIADVMPERPGFAFGLTCLALIAGALPVMLRLTGTITPVPAALWVLGSAALLWGGLTWAQQGHIAEAGLRPRPEEV